MTDWTANHINFVIAAYAIVALVLMLVVGSILWRAATLRKTLAEMRLSDPGKIDTP